jgi:hypothetical protein
MHRPMTPRTSTTHFKTTSPALNNVESRAGIGQLEGAAQSAITVALPVTVSAMSAPIETGELL